MGHFHIFKSKDGLIFFFNLKDMEMPFPLEMRRFSPFKFLLNPLKNHRMLKG